MKTPGFSWSYTGYKADLTSPGVAAHEMGHHTEATLKKELSPGDVANWRRAWGEARTSEARVSSYEPNAGEAFAESMKLFILNPELLREGRPMRWKFLTETAGLKPVHSTPWKAVLRNAHPRLIEGGERWLKG